MTVTEYNQYRPINEKGEYATYMNGKFTGYQAMATIVSAGQNILVPVHTKPVLEKMIADAKADGVEITMARGFATIGAQIFLRKSYIKAAFKAFVNDLEWLLNAAVDCFSPVVGKPGYSNHQNIQFPAVDFNVTKSDPKTGKRIGNLPSYAWLVKNAHKYGYIRTVPSERWHWEYRPGVDMFEKVKKTDPTWDGLV